MMTKDGLIFEANSLKQGRLQALTRQQLQAQATQNRERRWVAPTVPWPLFSRSRPTLPPHAPRHADQRGQVVRRPSPAGYCLTPTAELPKTERGPISTSGPSIQYVTEPGDSCGKINPFFPLAAAQPLTVLSWSTTLNANGSRRPCRIAISRNACSLPDFPEFTQAVRHGVPGTQ